MKLKLNSKHQMTMKRIDNITNIIMMVLTFTIMFLMSSCSKPELPVDPHIEGIYDSLRLIPSVGNTHGPECPDELICDSFEETYPDKGF